MAACSRSQRAAQPSAPAAPPRQVATERLALDVPTRSALWGDACDRARALGDTARTVQLGRTFVDDFDTFRPLGGKWDPHGKGGYDWFSKRTLAGNDEQEVYVDPDYPGTGKVPLGLNPYELEGGVLALVARRIPAALRASLNGYEFQSGMIANWRGFAQTYGYFEARAKMPAGWALWPAFWLVPADKSWPPEIDVFEVVGSEPHRIAMGIHFSDPGDGAHRSTTCRVELPSSTSHFHTYGVLWERAQLTFYIDRRAVLQMDTPPDLHKPMYLIANLAVGGKMVGKADARTPEGARFELDYITAYAE
jgi:beta-glucanase (GH16 family)